MSDIEQNESADEMRESSGPLMTGEKPPMTKPTNWPERIFYKIESLISFYLIGGMILFVMLWIATEIISRLIFDHTFYGVVDIIELAILVLVFASLSGVQREKSHMTMDLLEHTLRGKRSGFILQLIVLLLSLVVAFIFTHQGLMAFLRAYQSNTQTLALFWVKWPVIIFIPIGFFLLLIRVGIQVKQNLARLFGIKHQ